MPVSAGGWQPCDLCWLMQQRETPKLWSGHWMRRKRLNANATKFIGCPCVRNWKNCAMLNENHRRRPQIRRRTRHRRGRGAEKRDGRKVEGVCGETQTPC